MPAWTLKRCIPNPYPYAGNDLKGSIAHFRIYEKVLDAARAVESWNTAGAGALGESA
jgi:hypothetical protein